MIYELYFNDALPFLEFVTTQPRGLAITDTLAFTENVKVSPISISIIEKFFIGSQVSIRTSIKNLSFTDNIHFEDHAAKGTFVTFTDFLPLQDNIKRTPDNLPVDTLTLTESITIHKAKNATDTLTFTDTVGWKLVRNLSFTDTLSLDDGLAVYMNKCGFNALGDVALTEPDYITLTCGSLVLTLRNPEFGDSRALEIARINRKTKGGDLIVFRDPSWPLTEILRFAFDSLTEIKAYQFDHFLQVSLGQLITLIDYEGRTWQGVIRSPQGNIRQQGRCQYQAEFEFEGTLL